MEKQRLVPSVEQDVVLDLGIKRCDQLSARLEAAATRRHDRDPALVVGSF
jgi:hypothetical protein